MKIVILYDSSEEEACDLYSAVSKACAAPGAVIETFATHAAGDGMKPCIGCFGCWVKTPGICIYKNDRGAEYLHQVFDADYMLVISRITWGGFSTGIKFYIDRLLPLLHPYFRKFNGEMHHQLRYEKLPVLLSAGYGAGSDDEAGTYKTFIDSFSDNLGKRNLNNFFIIKDDKNISECVRWFETEVSKWKSLQSMEALKA